MVDSAKPELWRKYAPTGLFFGVTTNPVILEKDGQACTLDNLKRLSDACFDAGYDELQVQTWGPDARTMAAVGEELALIDPRIVVKVPVTLAGLEAASALIRCNINVTMTGVYAPHQVLSAVAAGAMYAAPYLGRMNDNGRPGRQHCVEMQQIIGAQKSELRLLVASIRSAEDMTYLASRGCDTVRWMNGHLTI